jgi:hypothetical protein
MAESEADLQVKVADYLRLQYPSVIFHSDYGSGIKLTMAQAVRQKRQNGGRRAWPDMFIAEPRGESSGLFIELKREGTRLKKKTGEFASKHIEEQVVLLEKLRRKGYTGAIVCGFDEAKTIIDRYLK